MARIIFLQRIWYEYGGPEIISAVLKKYGYEVKLFIGQNANAFIDKIYSKDIVCFSVMTGEHHWALKVASELKTKKEILTVFGGPHPTYFPEIVKHSAVDIACRGEGEYAMLDIANSYEKNGDFSNIQNLILKNGSAVKINELRPPIPNLDNLPFFDRDIYYQYSFLRKNFSKPFMASRGCPYYCSFCFNEKLREFYAGKGNLIRFRSPENIISEIEDVQKKFGLGSVFFADDLFVFNKDWLKEFCALYKKKIHKSFICSANILTLDEVAIKLLKEAGCGTVSFGIETGNESLRLKVLNKNIKNSQIEETARLLKKYDLPFMTFNIIGLPEETAENALETVSLNIKIGAKYPRCSILVPYPGTRIAEELKSKYHIDLENLHSEYQQSKIMFKNRYTNSLCNLHYFFQTAVVFPKSLGIIRMLIKLPPNILFKLWWAVVYFFIFTKAERRNLFQTFIFSSRSFNLIFKKKD